jgi:hypothetical protein
MYCVVRRTLTTKSERKFFIMTSNILHPSFPVAIFDETGFSVLQFFDKTGFAVLQFRDEAIQIFVVGQL